MEWTIILSFATLKIQVKRLGEDYFIIMQGGDKPHIGCTVLSIPRPSLSGEHQRYILHTECDGA